MTSRAKWKGLPRSPMPKFCADLAYRTIEIPNPSIPTVAGKPVVRMETSPMRWEHK